MRGLKSRYKMRKLKKEIWSLYELESESLSKCPCCASDDFILLRSSERYNFPIKTYLCLNCILGWSNPFPNQKFLDHFYSTYLYRSLYKCQSIASSFDYDAGDQKSRLVCDNFELIPPLATLLESEQNAKVLDYGCGAGSIINELARKYPKINAYGYEPGTAFNPELSILFSALSKDQITLQRYEIITCFHVLEHVLDFRETLNLFFTQLTPNGILYIEVPCIDKYKETDKLYHIAHPLHFSKSFMVNMLKQVGFKILAVDSSAERIIDKVSGCLFIAQKQ